MPDPEQAWNEWRATMRRVRHSRQLTIAQVADDLGVSRQSISNWENDVNRPSRVNAHKWAAALDRTVPTAVLPLLRSRDDWARPPASCGTDAGYIRHQRNHEPICEPCREAHRAYQALWRQRRRDRRQNQDPA